MTDPEEQLQDGAHEEHHLDAHLARLEDEERLVSARRRKLHERMAIFPDDSGELERQERELSARRRALHRQIDEVREQRGAARDAEPDEQL